MIFNAEIIADSINTFGNRLTTMKLTYPRIVHAELMTHRMFSRNASSSRAVPVEKMIKAVRANMFTPLAIQKAHKGMQGDEYFTGIELEQANKLWIESAELALKQAEKMNEFGITKQLVNRLLEPFQYYQVLVTSSEWENFFNLRCPQYRSPVDRHFLHKSKKDCISAHSNPINLDLMDKMTTVDWLQINESQAEIHIQAIAELMWDAYNESVPKQLKAGEWHIPFGDNFDEEAIQNYIYPPITLSIGNKDVNGKKHRFAGRNVDSSEIKVKIATARCARISYQTLGDNPKIDYEADIKLHDVLVSNGHASPLEHVAKAMSDEEYFSHVKSTDLFTMESFDNGVGVGRHIEQHLYNDSMCFGWCRNFKGFIQYRHIVETL